MSLSLSHSTNSKERFYPRFRLSRMHLYNFHFLIQRWISFSHTAPLQRKDWDSAECVCTTAKWVDFHSHGQTSRWDNFLPKIPSQRIWWGNIKTKTAHFKYNFEFSLSHVDVSFRRPSNKAWIFLGDVFLSQISIRHPSCPQREPPKKEILW